MAEITFRANLNAAEIPFLTSLLGRTVIIPGLDQNSVKSAQFAGSGESLDQGIPQILYAENVLPTDFGVQSIGYKKTINAAVGVGGQKFDQLITLRDVDENTFLFSPARGKCWIYDAFVGDWKSNYQLDPVFTGRYVSKSNLNGHTYVCFEKRGFYEYSTVTKTLQKVTFSGLVEDEILGICNSGNYNIAYTVDLILWSSLTDQTDFVPSLATGAGSAIPQDLKGPIVCTLPISGGMIIYTTKNVVVGLATNNARYPFNFKEIANAGGIQTSEHASFENGLGTHYAWTSAGLQKITTAAAETVFPAATDFLAGRRIEDFDNSTNEFVVTRSPRDFRIKLTYLESRYLIVSYGVPVGQNFLLWSEDLTQDVWGKRYLATALSTEVLTPFGTEGVTAVTYTGAGTVPGDGFEAYVNQTIDLGAVAGEIYTFSIWLRADTSIPAILSLQDGASITAAPITITTNWKKYSVTHAVISPTPSDLHAWVTNDIISAGAGIIYYAYGGHVFNVNTENPKYLKTTISAKTTGDENSFDYCLVYDAVLRRWGKLKITHVDCFDYTYPSVSGILPYSALVGSYDSYAGVAYSQLIGEGSVTPTPKKSIGFLLEDGTIYLADFEFDQAAAAVLLLGKFQLTRTSNITLQIVEIENPTVEQLYTWNPLNPSAEVDRLTAAAANIKSFNLAILPSRNGRNFNDAQELTLREADTNLLSYAGRITAKSMTLKMSGSFHQRSVVITATRHGRR